MQLSSDLRSFIVRGYLRNFRLSVNFNCSRFEDDDGSSIITVRLEVERAISSKHCNRRQSMREPAQRSRFHEHAEP